MLGLFIEFNFKLFIHNDNYKIDNDPHHLIFILNRFMKFKLIACYQGHSAGHLKKIKSLDSSPIFDRVIASSTIRNTISVVSTI